MSNGKRVFVSLTILPIFGGEYEEIVPRRLKWYTIIIIIIIIVSINGGFCGDE